MEEQTQQAQSQGGAGKNDQNKAVAIIGYIIPILFFIPFLSEAKNNAYAKFHANQQLNLLLWWIAGQIVATLLYIILIGFLIQLVVWIGGIIFMILGIINAAKGEMTKLPLIGGVELIK